MQYTWKDIEQHIAACTGCLLSQTRHRPVMGRGDYQADIMLIAEAPGGGRRISRAFRSWGVREKY